MMNSVKHSFVEILVCLLLLLDGAAWADDAVIAIGAIYPLSGPAAHLGESNRRGASIAIQLINERGGIGGKQLSLVVEDSQTEPAVGVSAFRKLTNGAEFSVILTSLTSVAMALRPLAEAKQIVLFAESTHPEVARGFDYTVRYFFTGKSAAAARQAIELAIDTVLGGYAICDQREVMEAGGLIWTKCLSILEISLLCLTRR